MERFPLGGKRFENIKFMIQHSDSELLYNDIELGDYYLDLIKLRHNLLHFAVLDMIGMEWEDEKTVRSFIGIDDSNKLLDKTPDIQLLTKNYYTMIDVSISTDTSTTALVKLEKYNPVVLYLKTIGFVSEFIHVNCNITRKNLLKEIEKLTEFRKKDFEIQDLASCFDMVESKMNVVRENIGREYFDKLKLEKFSNSIEQMGYVDDLELDLDAFKEFNKNFSIESEILTTYEQQLDEEKMCDIFKEILETKSDIYNKYLDNKFESDDFEDAHKIIKEKNKEMEIMNLKPTHHIVFPFKEELTMTKSVKEQDQILEFFKHLTLFENKLENENELFIFELGKETLKMFSDKNPNKKYNESVFYDFFRSEGDENLMTLFKKFNKLHTLLETPERLLDSTTKKYFAITDENYQEVKIAGKLKLQEMSEEYTYKHGNYSYKEFLADNDIVTNSREWFNTYAFRNKCVLTNLEEKSEMFKRFYKKTGISHKFHRKELNKNFNVTIPLNSFKVTDDFLNVLQEPSLSPSQKYSEYLSQMSKIDDEYSLSHKKELTEIFISKFEYLSSYKAFEYLEKTKLISTQLMHFTMLEMKPGSFSFFTCGIPNFICIVAGCYNKLFSQLGKPFMCCFFTENPNSYTDFFGKLIKTDLGNGTYLICTNWRRLPSFKLLHLKDQFYSITSSIMNSTLSFNNELMPIESNRIIKQLSFRTLVGCATGQKCSEFLVDVRYAYISSYAKYTNIKKLLIEKFSPPYKTSFETWIINKLFTRLPIINKSKSNIKLTSADYYAGKRTMNSMGVKFSMPSLWFDYTLFEINEFLDEAFCYVHTIKEPSNIYYENVKAINTIIKFQEQYDLLDENRKKGIYTDETEFRKFLLSNNQIGCFSRCIIQSANLMYNEDNPHFKKIIHDINDEDIGELVSTKAVISDNDRKITAVDEFTKKQYEKRLVKRDFYNSNITVEDLKKKYVMESNSVLYNNRKPRQKVFETTLELLEQNPEISKTINLANFFIKKEKGIVNADICIKAQYGSKREFYVINIGAKALARCTENFFKKICETNIHEAISIPGDNKMIEMQRMIDRVYMSEKIKPASKMIFVNGDCTKWSAAETMASFVSLIIPLKNKIPENMYNLLLSTYNSWSNKNIQIPLDIINNFIIPGDKEGDTKYSNIRKSILENNGKFKSTQNFLQGMYNYASSYKAVCCSNYTYHIWKKIYPNSTLYLEHMEHSDDYVLVVMTENFSEFEKFRVLHKMMMRCHGFNDSEKKTNCQIYMMEFVSLISFNGIMLYPQIKKTKEVNTNLPCVGYKSDIEASYSRVGEAMRMGCGQAFLYFMTKWQNLCVAEAYSLLPGMRNSYSDTLVEMLDTPIELFGIIDMLPLFSLFCKGNGNNYRLYKYGNSSTKFRLKYLLEKAQEFQLQEDVLVENTDFMYSLFNPKFVYERSNSSIVKLRLKLNWHPDDLIEFWQNNISYKFMKPRERTKLIKWLKSMFYNKTFTEAYSKSSRTKMTLRLSHFIRNPIISLKIDPKRFKDRYPEKNTTLLKIKEYIEYCEDDMINYPIEWTDLKEKSLIRIITKCDPTFDAVYEYLKNIKITTKNKNKLNNRPQTPIKTPQKITSFEIANTPSVIIQYMYNYDDFLDDKRRILSEYSLLKDIEIVKTHLLETIKEKVKTMEVLSLYNNLMILKERPIVCIGFSRKSETLKEQIGDIFRFNYLPYANCEISFSDVIKIKDPVTNKLLYTRGGKTTTNVLQQALENFTLLHAYMTFKNPNMGIDSRRKVLDTIIIRDPLNKSEWAFEEILEMTTIKNIKTFNLNLLTLKLLGYLKAHYLGENDILLHIVSNFYSYTYKYDTVAQRRGDKWYGETFGTFKHIENVVSFNNLDAPFTNNVIILAEKFNHRLLNLHYNIAMRLTSNITEKSFLGNPTRLKATPRKLFKTKDEALTYFDKMDVRGLYEIQNGKFSFVHPNNYEPNTEYVPFFKIGQLHNVSKEKKGKLRPSYLRIDNELLMVFLGRYKLFTLPVLNCRQFDIMTYKGGMRLYKELLTGDTLYNYFHRKTLNVHKKKPFIFTEGSILSEIKKQKLYDFYDDELISYIGPNLETSVKTVLKEKSGVLGFFIEQGLVIEKKTVDSLELKVEDLKLMEIFNDDFLVDEEIGIDLDDDVEFSHMPASNDIDFMSFYNLETDFLIKPSVSRKVLRQNYIIAKLKSLPSFQMEFNRHIYLSNTDSKKMDLYALIDNLKSKFVNLKALNDHLIWYEIYELLCNTYIKLHAQKTIHQYYLVGRKIKFLTNFSVPKTTELIEKLLETQKRNKNIQNIRILEKTIKFDINYNISTAMKKFNENCQVKFKEFRKNKYVMKVKSMNSFEVLRLLDEF